MRLPYFTFNFFFTFILFHFNVCTQAKKKVNRWKLAFVIKTARDRLAMMKIAIFFGWKKVLHSNWFEAKKRPIIKCLLRRDEFSHLFMFLQCNSTLKLEFFVKNLQAICINTQKKHVDQLKNYQPPSKKPINQSGEDWIFKANKKSRIHFIHSYFQRIVWVIVWAVKTILIQLAVDGCRTLIVDFHILTIHKT